MGDFGLKPALKAWVSATAALLMALGIEVAPALANPDSETINAIIIIAAPVVAFFATWLPSNKD